MALKVPKNKDKACCNDEGEGGSDIQCNHLQMNDMNKIRKEGIGKLGNSRKLPKYKW